MANSFLQPLNNQRGISLLLILIMVVIVSTSMAVAGSSWKSLMQRQREAELLFRGDQYRRAIESYYTDAQSGQVGQYPQELEDLLKDPRFPTSKKHIRKLYLDPMTGSAFEAIRDQRFGNRIKGVRSTSTDEPFKQDGFDQEYESFADAGSYQDWEFIYEAPNQKGSKATTVGGVPGAAAPEEAPKEEVPTY